MRCGWNRIGTRVLTWTRLEFAENLTITTHGEVLERSLIDVLADEVHGPVCESKVTASRVAAAKGTSVEIVS